MTTQNKYYFVIITANDCPNCVEFKRDKLDSLLTELKWVSDIETIEINLEKMTEKEILDNYHPKLKDMEFWFPSFFLLDKSWTDKSSNFRGSIFNGRKNLSGGFGLKPRRFQKPIDVKHIIKWIYKKRESLNYH